MHTYRIDAYLLDENGQNPTFEQTAYADSPEQARLIFKKFDDQMQTIEQDDGEGNVTIVATNTKKYLTRLLLAGYSICDNPSVHFREFGL